jgi:hypothetical protein
MRNSNNKKNDNYENYKDIESVNQQLDMLWNPLCNAESYTIYPGVFFRSTVSFAFLATNFNLPKNIQKKNPRRKYKFNCMPLKSLYIVINHKK